MDFVNNTPFSADVARATLPYRDLMLATVVVKCGFEVSPEGEVSLAAEQIAVQRDEVVTPYGTLDTDIVPVKQGCDFAVMGCARPFPSGRAATELDVRLRVGGFARHWRIFGDRRWQKTARGFEASPPEPFTEMVLGYERAYGGKAIYQRRQKVGCYENPEGKGFVVREGDVDGLPLPNLEDAEHLITTWQDQPQPAGLAPLPRGSSLRAGRGHRVDVEAQTTKVEPVVFNFSHPGMMLPAFPAGEPFELTGMGTSERMAFRVPSVRPFVCLELGGREHALPLVPDTLYVFPDHARFFVLARRAFVYQFIPERVRRITVHADASGTAASELTIRAARTDRNAGVSILPDDEELASIFDDVLRLDPMTELVESLPLCPSG